MNKRLDKIDILSIYLNDYPLLIDK